MKPILLALLAVPVFASQTPVTLDNLEDAESRQVIYTQTTGPSHAGLKFGDSKTPGARHFRIGFKQAIPVGAVMVRGGGSVSVLNPDDESQWIPAERVTKGEVGRDQYGLWTLPRVVQTRAIRFTHVAAVTDREYAGFLGGAYVLAERVADLAPQARVAVSANERYARHLTDGNTNPTWEQWSNISLKTGERPQPVSSQSPEWVLLTWHVPVKLCGLGAMFAGFAEAEAQVYTGPAGLHPREATESAWKTVASFTGLKNRYPSSLCADWLDFGQEYTTRALRLKITKPMPEAGHPHAKGHTNNGKRVWLGELVALTQGDAQLPPPPSAEQPPIVVKFTIPEPGYVTLVIEDSTGKRVRNLIAETYFDKPGEHIAYWDGSDDLGRDLSAAKHGLYLIPTQLVAPGNYRVRGLWRKAVNLRYEMGLYTAGNPPWETADKSGGWLANHTPPCAALFVPDPPTMLIGSYVSEGGAGLAWLDLDGKKRKGQNWVGGLWTGAPYLARDAGPQAVPGIYAYVGAAWDASTDKKERNKKGEIRITGLTSGEDKPIAKYYFDPIDLQGWESQMGGIAAHNGVIVASLTRHNKLIFISGKDVREVPMVSPRGIAFDAQGRLLALSGTKLMCNDKVIVTGLDDPQGLALDSQGNIYISDRGQSHQVKVFSPAGQQLRTIGKRGVPKVGPYDSLHMNNPRGLAVDPQGRVWVTEQDDRPKRVSVWNTDGSLAMAFYGPAEYGGGGAVDPRDKNKFYYNGMEFRLDKGCQLTHVFYRPSNDDLKLAFRSGEPQATCYVGDRRYWHNAWNSNPTGGHGTSFIFAERDGIAVPVAGAGRAHAWELLKLPEFAAVWPEGTDPKGDEHSDKAAFFLWSDLNADGKVQPAELQLQRGRCGGVTVMRDLSFAVSRLGSNSVCFTPKKFTDKGVPAYDIASGQTLVEGVQTPPSSGGDQVIVGPDGWTVHTTAPKPFSAHGLAGVKNGVPMWSYPSLWPGLHASHEAPVPDRLGQIIGHTRLLGDYIQPGNEPMWVLNQNNGSMCVFTFDGLFVAQLFHDMRVGVPWRAPTAERGMLLNDLAPGDENFWPSITQTPDGAVWLVAGGRCCLVRVEGLDTVKRIAASDLKITDADLNCARDYVVRVEAARQAAQGRGALAVAITSGAPDWNTAEWAEIDKRGTRAYFNSKSEPYDVTAALAISGDKLHARWRTGDPKLLVNSGDVPNALFKTGGALDLMLASHDNGDERLLVAQVNGKTKALLYRPVAKDRQPVPFSSPGRTITFDRVDDVSDKVTLTADKEGNYEISVPLSVLGLKPEQAERGEMPRVGAANRNIRGDIGILRGTGTTTTQRVYWSNKATAIVADVPSEAELQPKLWGRLEFK